MMPALDHCVNNTSEMTTLTKTLEVFDTYKHRDDKDSDEESFHLPLDDDDLDMNVTESFEPTKNGASNETEDEILNKFDNVISAVDNIDSQLEDHLLNEEDDEKDRKKEDIKNDDCTLTLTNNAEKPSDLQNQIDNCDEIYLHSNAEEITLKTVDTEGKNDNVNTDVDEKSNCIMSTGEDKSLENVGQKGENDICMQSTDNINAQDCAIEDCNVTEVCDQTAKASTSTSTDVDSRKVSGNDNIITEQNSQDRDQTEVIKVFDNNEKEPTEVVENFENSNDDNEDLFDISIIRDANEDNAESAYNEAHPEEAEEDDDRTDEKTDEECTNQKSNNEESNEELDTDKQNEHLKNDDVDIEETNLKFYCESTTTTTHQLASDINSDSIETETNIDQRSSENEDKSSESTVTNDLLNTVNEIVNVNNEENLSENSLQTNVSDGNCVEIEESDKENLSTRTSLKRQISEEDDIGSTKRSRMETEGNSAEGEGLAKTIEPLKTLLSLPNLLKTKKNSKRLTMQDLEEFCIQKICEVIVHNSELGDVYHQLKLQEQMIETMRKEVQQLTKQSRDLEIVNKKLINDLKQQATTQKPLHPLKITRSVGLQVKFTPTLELNVKRRPLNIGNGTHKNSMQQPISRSPKTVPGVANSPVHKQATATPQKQNQTSQSQTKSGNPILSQALQSRRNGATENIAKPQPQNMRAKPPDAKRGTSASVIDLTDEDDKNNTTSAKVGSAKNVAVSLRTAPVRVNTAPQGIRITTQGKVTPITSMVNSSTPQLMYVMQSPVQNSPLGSKGAVVVNFQSTNGVITSSLNGSSVSVIPKQGNTIQLKTLANNKIMKLPSKHPAPLPPPPVVRVAAERTLKPIPPKPHLTIKKTDTGIILQWKMPYELDMYENIASYQLYAYQETSALPSTEMWRKVGDVKALALPMACTLTQFADKNKYYFAVRPVDIHKRIGMFSDPEEISL